MEGGGEVGVEEGREGGEGAGVEDRVDGVGGGEGGWGWGWEGCHEDEGGGGEEGV